MNYPDTHDIWHPPSGYSAIGNQPSEHVRFLVIFRAILNDMDEAFYASDAARYSDRKAELQAHVESHLPKAPTAPAHP